MLKKFVSIKNIGVFRNNTAAGDTELRKLTLVHGDNGRGKTTLCAILRSLRTGDATLVLERKTLDGTGEPHVKVLIGGGTAEFKDGAWGSTCDHLAVFDADFIAANVYSGDAITHDHKRNLCRVVLGSEGVALAEAYDATDVTEREAGTVHSAAKAALQKLVPKGVSLDQFIELAEDPEVDRRIADKRGELAIIRDAAAIQQKGLLGKFALADVPINLTVLLAKTVDGVGVDAEERVRNHVNAHMMGVDGERWLLDGLGYVVGENTCPFCDQPLGTSAIFGPLRSFFSEAYGRFQEELTSLGNAVVGISNDAALLDSQKIIADNASRAEFWKKYTDKSAPSLSFDDRIQPAARTLRDTVNSLVNKKIGSPLDAIAMTAEADAAVKEWKKLREEIVGYNAAVDTFNAGIAEVKKASGSKSSAAIEQDLVAFEARKTRHEESGRDAVTAYQGAVAAKIAVAKAKEKAKADLDAYNNKVVGAYELTVNDILKHFGAAFRLKRVKIEYTGRTPRAGFAFGLRGVEIEPGSDKTPAGTPCFRNTLSSGDRSTLALAFFMAQVKNRQDLANLIIVFDDPFTSLDEFRQQWTCFAIRRLATDAKQVIVLSHSLDFLRLIANRCDKATTRTLKIDEINADSRIVELDLDNAAAGLVDKDVMKLRSYHHGEDKDSPAAIRCIRPVLENHMRKMAPDDCPAGNGWLGTFLGNVKTAPSGSPLAIFQADYDDYDYLNSYTSPYSHDSGVSPTISEPEAKSAIEICLTLIGRM